MAWRGCLTTREFDMIRHAKEVIVRVNVRGTGLISYTDLNGDGEPADYIAQLSMDYALDRLDDTLKLTEVEFVEVVNERESMTTD